MTEKVNIELPLELWSFLNCRGFRLSVKRCKNERGLIYYQSDIVSSQFRNMLSIFHYNDHDCYRYNGLLLYNESQLLTYLKLSRYVRSALSLKPIYEEDLK